MPVTVPRIAAGTARTAFALCAVAALYMSGGWAMAAERVILEPVGYDALPGWHEDRHGEALATFRRTCPRLQKIASDKPMGLLGGTVAEWRPACRAAATRAGNICRSNARERIATQYLLTTGRFCE